MKEPEFYRKKLDNGLMVLFEERKTPVVAVSSAIKFGAQYEDEKIKGISHFIEHLVFKGTKNRSVVEIPKSIESKGGVINAFTSEDITAFWNKLPYKYFKLGADVSRDLITNPLFDKESFERERKVILEEIKMYHDNPSTFVIEKIKELLYGHPFNMSVAGTYNTVSNISRETVLKTYNSVYTTNNMIFCVVGNTSWEEVIDEAKMFPNTKNKIKHLNIKLKNGQSVLKRKGIDQAHEVIGFHMPTLKDKNRYAAEIFDSILGGGMSSRLFQEVREKRGLCYAIKSHLEQSKDYSYEIIYAGTTKEKVKEVKNIVLNEIKKLKNLDKKDFDEAKENLIGQKQINMERSDSSMIELVQEEAGGDASCYYKYQDEINKVKLQQVRGLSQIKNYSFASLIPE